MIITNFTNMENGWIKLHRKLIDTSFFMKLLTAWLFIVLLLKARQQKGSIIWNKKPLDIEAGQLVTGRKVLSKESGLTERSVRTALDTLIATNTIAIKTTTKFSVITILNWEKYQQTTSEIANKRPTNDQQTTTNKNDKNDKNINIYAKDSEDGADLEKLLIEGNTTGITKEFQFFGLEMWKQLHAPPEKKVNVCE